jgi:hypothetical protein
MDLGHGKKRNNLRNGNLQHQVVGYLVVVAVGTRNTSKHLTDQKLELFILSSANFYQNV